MPYMKQIRMPRVVQVTEQTMFSPKNQGLEFDTFYGVAYMRENNDGLVVVGIEIPVETGNPSEYGKNKHERVIEFPFFWFVVISWVEE
tara:strand:- start:139 stop:402 length:264 start_codon:yes stop_codon:yes gene_type:complete